MANKSSKLRTFFGAMYENNMLIKIALSYHQYCQNIRQNIVLWGKDLRSTENIQLRIGAIAEKVTDPKVIQNYQKEYKDSLKVDCVTKIANSNIHILTSSESDKQIWVCNKPEGWDKENIDIMLQQVKALNLQSMTIRPHYTKDGKEDKTAIPEKYVTYFKEQLKQAKIAVVDLNEIESPSTKLGLS